MKKLVRFENSMVDEARFILQHYGKNRAVGHSHAVLYGAIDTKAVVLVHNFNAARLAKSMGVTAFPSVSYLIGKQTPLVMDNAYVEKLLNGILDEIGSLKHQVRELEKFIDEHQS